MLVKTGNRYSYTLLMGVSFGTFLKCNLVTHIKSLTQVHIL